MCGHTRINALTSGLKQLNVRAMSVILTEHRYRAYEPDQISREWSKEIGKSAPNRAKCRQNKASDNSYNQKARHFRVK